MSHLVLYQEYARPQLVAGREPARSYCGEQWLVLPGEILCFATLGAGQFSSRFESPRSFYWFADAPYRAAEDDFPFLPEEVRRRTGSHAPMRLFVRQPGQERFMYAGDLAPSVSYGFLCHQDHGHAAFELTPLLPTRLWRAWGLKPVGTGRDRSLDSHLAALPSASSRQRLALLDRVHRYWVGDVARNEGPVDESDRDLPLPLRHWLGRFGPEHPLAAGALEVLPSIAEPDDDGRLVICAEAEWVYEWSILPDGEDPRVWGRWNEDDEPWEPERVSLSEFLVQAALVNAIHQAPYGASAAWLEAEAVERLSTVLPALPLGPWRWPASPARLHACRGAFMFSYPNCDPQGGVFYSVVIGARSPGPLEPVREFVDGSWDRVDL